MANQIDIEILISNLANINLGKISAHSTAQTSTSIYPLLKLYGRYILRLVPIFPVILLVVQML